MADSSEPTPRGARQQAHHPPAKKSSRLGAGAWFSIAVLAAAVAAIGVNIARDFPVSSAVRSGISTAPSLMGHPPAVGTVAPDFDLLDAHATDPAKRVSLSSLTANGPVIVSFYLTLQCMRCAGHFKDLVDRNDHDANAAFEIVAVTSDPPSTIRDALKTYGDLSAPILADADMTVAQRYGLFENGEQLYGVFVIGADGRVAWSATGEDPYDDVDRILDEARRALVKPPR